nr:quinidine resistance protein 3 [Quercus suber]
MTVGEKPPLDIEEPSVDIVTDDDGTHEPEESKEAHEGSYSHSNSDVESQHERPTAESAHRHRAVLLLVPGAHQQHEYPRRVAGSGGHFQHDGGYLQRQQCAVSRLHGLVLARLGPDRRDVRQEMAVDDLRDRVHGVQHRQCAGARYAKLLCLSLLDRVSRHELPYRRSDRHWGSVSARRKGYGVWLVSERDADRARAWSADGRHHRDLCLLERYFLATDGTGRGIDGRRCAACARNDPSCSKSGHEGFAQGTTGEDALGMDQSASGHRPVPAPESPHRRHREQQLGVEHVQSADADSLRAQPSVRTDYATAERAVLHCAWVRVSTVITSTALLLFQSLTRFPRYLAGTFVGGRWADHTVKKWIAKRGNKRIPEDRLKSCLPAMGLVIPACMILYGWSIEKEVGGIPLPVIVMFVQGVAQLFCFPSLNTYCLDVMQGRSAEVVAGNYVIRYLFAAAGSAACLPVIDVIGVGWFSTISAAFVLVAAIGVWITATYGGNWRPDTDEGEKENKATS